MNAQIEPIREIPELSCRSILWIFELLDSDARKRASRTENNGVPLDSIKRLLCKDFMSKYNSSVSLDVLDKARRCLGCPVSGDGDDAYAVSSPATAFSLDGVDVLIVVDLLVDSRELKRLIELAGFAVGQEQVGQKTITKATVYNSATDTYLTCGILTTYDLILTIRTMDPETTHRAFRNSTVFLITGGMRSFESNGPKDRFVSVPNRITGKRYYSNAAGHRVSASFDLRLNHGIARQLAIFITCKHVWGREPYVPVADWAAMDVGKFRTRYFADVEDEQIEFFDDVGKQSEDYARIIGQDVSSVSSTSGVSDFLEVTNAPWAIFSGISSRAHTTEENPLIQSIDVIAAAQACRVFIEGHFSPFSHAPF